MTSHVQFLQETKEIQDLVEIIFPENKALVWMATPNPNFGNVSPVQMIMNGRGHKVKQFVEDAIHNNHVENHWHGIPKDKIPVLTDKAE